MTKNSLDSGMEGTFDQTPRARINNNLADVGIVATTVSYASNTTLADVAGMSTSTLTPGTYSITMDLNTTATANGGVKIGFKQYNGLTLSSITLKVVAQAAAAMATTKFSTATDAASIYAASAATLGLAITGSFVVATGGTMTLQMAQNASAGGGDTTSLLAGSNFRINRIGN